MATFAGIVIIVAFMAWVIWMPLNLWLQGRKRRRYYQQRLDALRRMGEAAVAQAWKEAGHGR